MRFTQFITLATSALVVAAAPSSQPINAEALEAFTHLNEPEAFAVFKSVVSGEITSLVPRDAAPEKRCCAAMDVCCNWDTCKSDVSYCLQYCANIVGAGQLGCIAGCFTVC